MPSPSAGPSPAPEQREEPKSYVNAVGTAKARAAPPALPWRAPAPACAGKPQALPGQQPRGSFPFAPPAPQKPSASSPLADVPSVADAGSSLGGSTAGSSTVGAAAGSSAPPPTLPSPLRPSPGSAAASHTLPTSPPLATRSPTTVGEVPPPLTPGRVETLTRAYTVVETRRAAAGKHSPGSAGVGSAHSHSASAAAAHGHSPGQGSSRGGQSPLGPGAPAYPSPFHGPFGGGTGSRSRFSAGNAKPRARFVDPTIVGGGGDGGGSMPRTGPFAAANARGTPSWTKASPEQFGSPAAAGCSPPQMCWTPPHGLPPPLAGGLGGANTLAGPAGRGGRAAVAPGATPNAGFPVAPRPGSVMSGKYPASATGRSRTATGMSLGTSMGDGDSIVQNVVIPDSFAGNEDDVYNFVMGGYYGNDGVFVPPAYDDDDVASQASVAMSTVTTDELWAQQYYQQQQQQQQQQRQGLPPRRQSDGVMNGSMDFDDFTGDSQGADSNGDLLGASLAADELEWLEQQITGA